MDQTKSEKNKANLHAGHRERLRERFIKNGEQAFASHELLEMLLFHSIPRNNTNGTAHELLERFGLLEAVLNAPRELIENVEGIGPSSIQLLQCVGAIMRRIAAESNLEPFVYRELKDVIHFVRGLFEGATVEKVYLMLFDNGMHLKKCVLLDEGIGNRSNIDAGKVVREANLSGATSVILAHNHPEGEALPSSQDGMTTEYLRETLERVGIRLIDHLIVGKNGVAALLHSEEAFRISVQEHRQLMLDK